MVNQLTPGWIGHCRAPGFSADQGTEAKICTWSAWKSRGPSLRWISKISLTILVGGWATPLKNMKVSWDDEIPNIWQNKKWQPNHQPAIVISSINLHDLISGASSRADLFFRYLALIQFFVQGPWGICPPNVWHYMVQCLRFWYLKWQLMTGIPRWSRYIRISTYGLCRDTTLSFWDIWGVNGVNDGAYLLVNKSSNVEQKEFRDCHKTV